MSTTHTPGPWSCNIPPHKFPIYAKHASRRFVYVASICRDGDVSEDEMDANARLIAQAPDLLASLRKLASWVANDIRLSGLNPDGPAAQDLAEALAVIARAEGKL